MANTTLPGMDQEGRDELTPDEFAQLLEEQTRRYFGISVAEFRSRAEEGSLPVDHPMVIHLALLTGANLHAC